MRLYSRHSGKYPKASQQPWPDCIHGFLQHTYKVGSKPTATQHSSYLTCNATICYAITIPWSSSHIWRALHTVPHCLSESYLIFPECPLPPPGCIRSILVVDPSIEVLGPAIVIPQIVASRCAVVQHNIHHHPQPQLMSSINKGAHVLQESTEEHG